MSCACGEPQDEHGNPDHITETELERAAEAAGISTEEAADHIRARR